MIQLCRTRLRGVAMATWACSIPWGDAYWRKGGIWWVWIGGSIEWRDTCALTSGENLKMKLMRQFQRVFLNTVETMGNLTDWNLPTLPSFRWMVWASEANTWVYCISLLAETESGRQKKKGRTWEEMCHLVWPLTRLSGEPQPNKSLVFFATFRSKFLSYFGVSLSRHQTRYNHRKTSSNTCIFIFLLSICLKWHSK